MVEGHCNANMLHVHASHNRKGTLPYKYGICVHLAELVRGTVIQTWHMCEPHRTRRKTAIQMWHMCEPHMVEGHCHAHMIHVHASHNQGRNTTIQTWYLCAHRRTGERHCHTSIAFVYTL